MSGSVGIGLGLKIPLPDSPSAPQQYVVLTLTHCNNLLSFFWGSTSLTVKNSRNPDLISILDSVSKSSKG